MAVVSYQPWYQYQTAPVWDVPLTTDNGNEDLTGMDITKFTMIFRSNAGTDTIGKGTFSVKVLTPAEIYYKPDPADVAQPFAGELIIKAYVPPSFTASDCYIYDPITPFVITAV